MRAAAAPPAVTGARREIERRLRRTALAYAVWLAGYEIVGRCAAALPGHDLSLPLDAAIPFVPAWVWVYQLTYLLPFLAPFAIEDGARFDRALRAILLAAITAYPIYLCLPVAFPHPALGESLAERALALERRLDVPNGGNHLPSLHVANAFILYLAVRGQRLGRLGDRAALGLATAIAASTLLLKQHIVVDVIAGGLWAAGAWWSAADRHFVRITISIRRLLARPSAVALSPIARDEPTPCTSSSSAFRPVETR